MSTTNAIYSKGSLLKEMNFAGLVRNTVVDGIVLEGQHSHAWMKLIEETNAAWEKNGGTGNKMLSIYKDEVAYTGDPTISAPIAGSSDLGGGRIRINLSSTQEGFRKDDGVSTGFGGQKVAGVIEAGSDYIIVGAIDGYLAPTTSDFPAGGTVIQYYRSIGIRGTKSPVGINQRPQVWENYLSIHDDAVQQSIFDVQNQVVVKLDNDYIKMAPVSDMMERFFRAQTFQQFMSKGVNPEDNGFTKTATKGIHQQIQDRGFYFPQTSLITQQEFEARLRQNLIANPGNDIKNKVILVGSISHALISGWYRDYIKYDAKIASVYVDGLELKGLNATKIFIPGFDFVQVVKWPMLDMNAMGKRSTIPGFTNLPQTSGSFYILDFSPVQTRTGTAPAFQKFYFGGAKYFYSLQQGLTSVSSIEAVMQSATPVTESNLSLTSTDNDFSNLRVYSMCGLNIMNPTAHTWINNLV